MSLYISLPIYTRKCFQHESKPECEQEHDTCIFLEFSHISSQNAIDVERSTCQILPVAITNYI